MTDAQHPPQQQQQQQQFQPPPISPSPAPSESSAGGPNPGDAARADQRDERKKQADKELAEHLSRIIEDANERVLPLCRMIRSHIESFEAKSEEERNENELIKAVKPLLEQAQKIMDEANGMVKGADPDKRLSNRATRHADTHQATPEEQRLASALKVMIEEVGGTIDWAKDKLNKFPKAKRDLGPLLDALGQPLTQIVGGVGLLLAGVLNLVGNLLSGLGLDSLLTGILKATGLTSIYKGLGVDKWLNSK